MQIETVQALAREGRLYPSVILYGTDPEGRRAYAVALARTLLCAASPAAGRPCGDCRACRRVAWPTGEPDAFHPDFHVLERDLKTATSADATKAFLRSAYRAPFEAGAQVFVVAEADSLRAEAADALLKILEEPPERTPRHFLLLTAAARDLLPTLRSRSLSLFLGAAAALDEEQVATLSEGFGDAVGRFLASRSPVYLLRAAEVLGQAGGFEDARARRPWSTAAAVVVRHLHQDAALTAPARRALLDLAADLLDAPQMRLRFVPHGRILEGLLSRHLGSMAPGRG